jgi:hypothetical protein
MNGVARFSESGNSLPLFTRRQPLIWQVVSKAAIDCRLQCRKESGDELPHSKGDLAR